MVEAVGCERDFDGDGRDLEWLKASRVLHALYPTFSASQLFGYVDDVITFMIYFFTSFVLISCCGIMCPAVCIMHSVREVSILLTGDDVPFICLVPITAHHELLYAKRSCSFLGGTKRLDLPSVSS